jgi:hypothetical protein
MQYNGNGKKPMENLLELSQVRVTGIRRLQD